MDSVEKQLVDIRESEKQVLISLKTFNPFVTDDSEQQKHLKHHASYLFSFLKINATNENAAALQFSSLKSMDRIFTKLFEQQNIQLESNRYEYQKGKLLFYTKAKTTKDQKEATELIDWANIMYADYIGKLLDALFNSDYSTQVLETLLGYVTIESVLKYQTKINNILFDNLIFDKIIVKILLNSQMHETTAFENLIGVMTTKCFGFDDSRYYALNSVRTFLQTHQTMKEEQIRNIYKFLISIKIPSSIITSQYMVNISEENLNNKKRKREEELDSKNKISHKDVVSHKRLITDIWTSYLKQSIPIDIYKKVMVKMPDLIIPFVSQPHLFLDFFTESYDKGGVISILALNGLFTLMTKYNLDYPDFYSKLYSLLDSSIFHMRYRSRFFYLLNIFLSSSLLPSYLVAFYIKKLARITLEAPPSGCMISIILIYILLQRHPSCIPLIHRPVNEVNVSKQVLLIGQIGSLEDSNPDISQVSGFDIFDSTKELKELYDLSLVDKDGNDKEISLQSSLWELSALTNHYCPSVSRIAKIFEGDLKKQIFHLEDFLDECYQSMFDAELMKKKKGNGVPLSFKSISSIFKFTANQESIPWTFSK